MKVSLSDYQGAIADFSKGIEIKPTAVSYFLRASAKSLLEKWRSAIEDYTKAIEYDSKYALAYHMREIAKLVLGDSGGCSDLKKATDLGELAAKEDLKKYCK